MSVRQSKVIGSSADRRAYFARMLFSLSGVLPIGAFMVLHLWTYASALRGHDALAASLDEKQDVPYLILVEGLLIWAPLLYHGLYGLVLTFKSRPNVGRYPYFRNYMHLVQRVTGVMALGFIAYHFWHFRWQLLSGRLARDDVFFELCATLSSTQHGIPVIALVYLFGTAACTFHLANGLYEFCFRWGITGSRRASRVASGAFGIVGLLLFALGANSIIYFATGSRLVFAPRSEDRVITCADASQRNELTRAYETPSSPVALQEGAR